MKEFYTYEVQNHKGETVSLADYQGKVVLIVNTASKCGFTPQYEGLQKLHEQYHDKGLEILAFPCNQFGQQESGTNDEIQSFCQFNFGLTFPVFGKLDVNGTEEAPLYSYLKSEKKGLVGRNIKWNFTKFMIDREGNVIKRYAPTVKPSKMVSDIEKLIGR